MATPKNLYWKSFPVKTGDILNPQYYYNWRENKMPTIMINLKKLKKHASAIGLDMSPGPSLQARAGWDNCPALLHSSTRKNIRHRG